MPSRFPPALALILLATPVSAQLPTAITSHRLSVDPFWSRPVTYLDYYLLSAKERLSEQAALLTSRTDLFTWPDMPGTNVRALAGVDSASGRVILTISIDAAQLNKPIREVCISILDRIEWALGTTLLQPTGQFRQNAYSGFLPRSAWSTTDPATRDRAYDALEASTDFQASIFETRVSRGTSCVRAQRDTVMTIKTYQ